VCYIPCPPNPPWFDQPNSICTSTSLQKIFFCERLCDNEQFLMNSQKFQFELSDDGRILLTAHSLHMAGVLAQHTLFALAVKLWQQEHYMNREWHLFVYPNPPPWQLHLNSLYIDKGVIIWCDNSSILWCSLTEHIWEWIVQRYSKCLIKVRFVVYYCYLNTCETSLSNITRNKSML
jgi:hypothetical protein